MLKKLLFCCFIVAVAVLVSGYTATKVVTYKTYTVAAGETLWEIASTHMKQQDKTRDVRELVFDIAEYNNLRNRQLQPGDVIVIPLEVKK